MNKESHWTELILDQVTYGLRYFGNMFLDQVTFGPNYCRTGLFPKLLARRTLEERHPSQPPQGPTEQKVEKKVDSPHKVSAHRAEGWLSEEGGDELVVLYEVDLGLFDGSSASVQGGSLFLLHRLFTV